MRGKRKAMSKDNVKNSKRKGKTFEIGMMDIGLSVQELEHAKIKFCGSEASTNGSNATPKKVDEIMTGVTVKQLELDGKFDYGESDTDSDESHPIHFNTKKSKCKCSLIFIMLLILILGFLAGGGIFLYLWLHVGIFATQSPSMAPSEMPSDAPSFIPSYTPTTIPTLSISPTSNPSHMPSTSSLPSFVPSSVPSKSQSPTNLPSVSPTTTPSQSPSTVVLFDGLVSAQGKAHKFMIQQADVQVLRKHDRNKELPNSDITVKEKLYQRHAMLSLWYSLSERSPPDGDECTWSEIDCDGWEVTKIKFGAKNFNGVIPTIIGQLSALEYLDLGENLIRGSIPEQLYDCVKLKYLYLHDNLLTGTISESLEKLDDLRELYLSMNKLTGELPKGLRKKRKLRYLTLGRNQLSGTLSSDFSLYDLFYLDLSFNKFTSSVPSGFFDGLRDLRHIYLDHNSFSGRIPTKLVTAGSNNMHSIYLSNNLFTGGVPYTSSWVRDNGKLCTLSVKNNLLKTKISRKVCNMSIFEYGDMVQLEADCRICTCDELCDSCGSYDATRDSDSDDDDYYYADDRSFYSDDW